MSQNKTITLLDIKQALKDSRFRDTLPPDMMEEVHKFLKNPGCACNMPLYRKILSDCSDQIKQYFPNREISNIQEEVKRLAQNKFSVINCSVDDLEGHLRKLGVGRKQIAISRYEDQVTVIVNDLDVIY